MAFIESVKSSDMKGVDVHYDPAYRVDGGRVQPAFVRIELGGNGIGNKAYLAMDVTEARGLAAALMNVILLHDAAERLAAVKAVA
ncbi:hypothetical protein [Nocardia wallacei]|uniref:hypothetical protein n=1 Tax=Nocardia wallacei TaxID=480035 RepID=UPI002455276F|nr:hypothetical protein [Nocardia wallacei]